MSFFSIIIIVVASIIGMEALAYFMHKYIMHGFMWSWHKTHHIPHKNKLEKNDLFGVFFALPSIIFIFIGIRYLPILYYIGVGIGVYGLLYFVFHDMVVHQRIKTPLPRNISYLKRIIQAHRLHHAVEEKDGAVSFGFLYAPPIKELKQALHYNQSHPKS